MSSRTEEATLGGGCFWCTEAIFRELNGVKEVTPGYCGGHKLNPTYEEVCTNTTGHAEVIHISFYPETIDFSKILEVFFATHNPTTLNKQGEDVGTQYRSVIFYHSERQKQVAEKVIQQLESEKIYMQAIVTEVEKFNTFFPAENYHQNYYAQNKNKGYCQITVTPKIEKFKKIFNDILKSNHQNK